MRRRENTKEFEAARDVGKLMAGIYIMHVLVCDEHGKPRGHLMAFDAWRRLLFLGAGELEEEWMAGLLGVCGDDLRGSRLDERLRDLRVLRLQQVRLLVCKADDTALARGKLNACQRRKRAREREQHPCVVPPGSMMAPPFSKSPSPRGPP